MPYDVDTAWQVARAFARGLSARLGGDLVSAVVIGSLADQSYVPGASEVDMAVILRHDADDELESVVEAARSEAQKTLSEALGVRCALLTQADLHPPYLPERETAPIVLQVHDLGIVVAGEDLRTTIERPTPAEFRAYIKHYDRLVRDSLSGENTRQLPPYRELHALAAAACRHYIFCKENLLIWRKTEVLLAFLMGYEDHAHAGVVRRFLESGAGPQPVSVELVEEVSALWRGLHGEVVG